MRNLIIVLIISTSCSTIFGQTVFGIITDAHTGEPLEGVNIYFNQTTYGTITNDEGIFVLPTDTYLKSSLVISRIGYQTVVHNNPYEKKITLRLFPEVEALDDVIITQDLWTRAQKLAEFKKQFIGTSEAAKFCTILNEDDIDLRFISEQKALVASAEVPIKLRNTFLNYDVLLYLKKYRSVYKTKNPSNKVCTSVYMQCTSFFKELDPEVAPVAKQRRLNTYIGSIPHFIKSIYNGTLKNQDYKLYEHNETAAISSYSLFNETYYSKNDLKKKRLSQKRALEVTSVDSTYKTLRLKKDFLLEHPSFDPIVVSQRSNSDPIRIYPSGYFSPGDGIRFTFDTTLARMGNLLPFNYVPDALVPSKTK